MVAPLDSIANDDGVEPLAHFIIILIVWPPRHETTFISLPHIFDGAQDTSHDKIENRGQKKNFNSLAIDVCALTRPQFESRVKTPSQSQTCVCVEWIFLTGFFVCVCVPTDFHLLIAKYVVFPQIIHCQDVGFNGILTTAKWPVSRPLYRTVAASWNKSF